jgi:hypothetical protein
MIPVDQSQTSEASRGALFPTDRTAALSPHPALVVRSLKTSIYRGTHSQVCSTVCPRAVAIAGLAEGQ